jgi:hypothetical protein
LWSNINLKGSSLLPVLMILICYIRNLGVQAFTHLPKLIIKSYLQFLQPNELPVLRHTKLPTKNMKKNKLGGQKKRKSSQGSALISSSASGLWLTSTHVYMTRNMSRRELLVVLPKNTDPDFGHEIFN